VTAARTDVVTFGETMGLFAEQAVGRVRSGTPFEFRIGGSESNVAIGLARLDCAVCWMGRVGRDTYGDEIIRTLRGEGVTVQAHRDPQRPTAMMVKTRPAPHHQRISYYRSGSAGAAFGPDDVDDECISTARVLHVSGISLAISPSAAAAVEHAVAVARAAGTLVSLDVNYRSRLWPRAEAAARLHALLPRVDLLFGNTDEARLLTDCTQSRQVTATQLLRLGPGEVVLTGGTGGAAAVTATGEVATVPALAVPVVDTVGAGDAFVAGYLAARLQGASLDDRLDLAATTGAFACMSEGDWEGAPTRDELTLIQISEPVER